MKTTRWILPTLLALGALALASYVASQANRRIAALEVQIQAPSRLSYVEKRLEWLASRLDKMDRVRPATGDEISALREEVRQVHRILGSKNDPILRYFEELGRSNSAMSRDISDMKTEVLHLRGQVLNIIQNPAESRLIPANRE